MRLFYLSRGCHLASLRQQVWRRYFMGSRCSLSGNSDGWHSARIKEGFGDDHGEAEKQAADDGHFALVGVAAADLPAAMRDDDDGHDEKETGNDSETFGHRTVEGGLSEK